MKSFVKEDKIWHIFRELVDGLVALHGQSIVHRDIKCANVFLINNGGVKLGDLNVSKIAKIGIMQTQTGTPYYCPPEVWEDQPYSSKCDIWSLGCVIYELASLKPPFLAKNMAELSQKVIKGVYPDIPKHFSSSLKKIIALCLNTNPSSRPSAYDLAKMPELGLPHSSRKFRIKQKTSKRASSETQKQTEMLETIRLPKNLNKLNDVLPKSNYEEEQVTDKQYET